MNAISSSFSFQSGRGTAFPSAQQSQRGGLAQQSQRGGNFAQAQNAQRGVAPQQTLQTQRAVFSGATNATTAARSVVGATGGANNSSSFCPGCNTAGGRQAPVTGFSFGSPTGGQAGGSHCIGCR